MNDPQDPSSGPAVTTRWSNAPTALERGLHGGLVADVQHDLIKRGQVRPLLGRGRCGGWRP